MNDLKKELITLEKKENKYFQAAPRQNKLKQTVYEKVPHGLRTALETAFSKAFQMVFLKGTWAIEKTFDKENASLEYEAGNFVVDKAGSRKSIRRMDKGARKDNLLNNGWTTVSGAALGLLGMGIPDIPLLVSTLLKGIYEIAIGYGFDYEAEEEKIYILRLVRTALSEGEQRSLFRRQLDSMSYVCGSLEEEIAMTAKVLSDALLVEKFVQGIPVVGVVGGLINYVVYTKISTLAGIKYKKRYLSYKLGE